MSEETWDSVAIALLETVRAKELEGLGGDLTDQDIQAIVTEKSISPPMVFAELRRLVDSDIIDGEISEHPTGLPIQHCYLTERGAKALGMWPTDEEW